MKLLGDISQVFAGLHFRGGISAAPKGTIPVLQVKDLQEDGIAAPTRFETVEVDSRAEKYLARPGDVIYLARGLRNLTAVVGPEHDGILVPSFFLIIRPDQSQLDPQFLVWYLEQPQAREHLVSMAQGTAQLAVPASAMRTLLIELPPLDLQLRIGELQQFLHHEQRIHRRLEAKRQQD